MDSDDLNFNVPKKKMWVRTLRVFLDGIGIVLSIIIAFAIENWDEEQKKREKEDFYLQSVYSDLNKDYLELDRRIKEYKVKMENTEKILNQLEKESSNYGKIFGMINERLTYNFSYVPFNHTYKALESSGDIKLIRNEKFKLLLFELDKSFYTTTLYGNLFLDYTHSKMWAGYLMDHMNYQKNDLLEATFSNIDEKAVFYNRVKRLHELMEMYYYNMQGTLLKIKEVQQMLEGILEENGIKFEKVELESEMQTDAEEEEELENLLEDL